MGPARRKTVVRETLRQAAEREVREETGIKIKAGEIVHIFELIDHNSDGSVRFHYVIVDLLGEYVNGQPRPGDDALETGWFSKEELKRLQVNATTKELLLNKVDF